MKHTKRFLTVALAAMLALTSATALAEGEANESADTQMTQMQTPPALPDGTFPGGPGPNGGQPPEKPDGSFPAPPEMPGGMGGPGGAPGGMGGSAPEEYSAAVTLTENADGGTYASSADSESAVLVSGSDVTLTSATVSKTGDADSESADFYGINAAVLATDGAALTIENAQITTDGAHANAVFSYGSGTTVNVSDTAIITTGNNSGGLMTTGGAAMNAVNVTVSTAGNSSAAIRSDRGGGTVNVQGGTYETTGRGSPAIYSTADITVSGAVLSASGSEAVVIEGGNSVTLNGVQITGNDAVLNGQSTVKTNVLIYQSMSGDAQDGSSVFTMTGGDMTALTGDMFHVTNVTTTISLTGVAFHPADDSSVFLSASADAWGSSGSNGGHVTLNLASQEIAGDLTADALSSLHISLTENSSLTGAVNSANASQDVTVTLDGTSVWTLTGDSYLTAFTGDLAQVNLNGFTLYIAGEAQ